MTAAAAAATPGAAGPGGDGIGGEVVAVLAEAQVLTVLTGDRPLSQAGITRRVDAGYRALVPAALNRLAGQGLVEEAGCRRRPRWRLAG